MRERDRTGNFHAVSLPGSPHGAGEIAKPICGKQSGVFEGRNEKRAGQVCLMVFDTMELRSYLIWRYIKGLRDGFWNAHKASHHFGSLTGKARHLQGIHELCSQARPRVSWNGNMADLRKSDAGGVQAIANRRGWKSSGVFHTVKSFFLNGRDQATVRNQC